MTAPAPIDALLFDGRSARGAPVRLAIDGDDLRIDPTEPGGATPLRVPLARIEWPERTRHGLAVLHLPNGGALQPSGDAEAWQRWLAAASGRRATFAVRAQQSWRATLVALVLLVAAAAAGYRWGVPLAARAMLAAVPSSVDARIGALTLDALQQRGSLKPSRVPTARQQALRDAFAAMLERARNVAPEAVPAVWTLHFAAADRDLGPNAIALPGGLIVVTDELVTLLAGRDDAMLGVLGHEAGHLVRRHGMRLVLQAALVAAATSAAFGDFSSVVASAPALLGHLAYSRDVEREADANAIVLMRASGISPSAMRAFFERLEALPPDARRAAPGFGLASHPPDEERLRAFDAAALPATRP